MLRSFGSDLMDAFVRWTGVPGSGVPALYVLVGCAGLWSLGLCHLLVRQASLFRPVPTSASWSGL